MTMRTKHILFSLMIALILSTIMSFIGVPFLLAIAVLAMIFIFVPDATWIAWNQKFWGTIDRLTRRVKTYFK